VFAATVFWALTLTLSSPLQAFESPDPPAKEALARAATLAEEARESQETAEELAGEESYRAAYHQYRETLTLVRSRHRALLRVKRQAKLAESRMQAAQMVRNNLRWMQDLTEIITLLKIALRER